MWHADPSCAHVECVRRVAVRCGVRWRGGGADTRAGAARLIAVAARIVEADEDVVCLQEVFDLAALRALYAHPDLRARYAPMWVQRTPNVYALCGVVLAAALAALPHTAWIWVYAALLVALGGAWAAGARRARLCLGMWRAGL